MRIFWSIIALLVLATVAMLYARGRSKPPAPAPAPSPVQTADAPRPTPTPAPPVVETPPAPLAPDPSPPPPRTPQVAQTPAPPEDPNPAPAVELPVVPERDDAASTEHLKPGFIGPPPPPHSGAVANASETDNAEQFAATPPSASVTNGPASAPTGAAGVREPSAADSAAAAAAAAQGPARLEPQPDGTVLVDGRFVMRGDGTRANPYEVTWEHLMSVQETYKPRMGLKVIPDRVQMLHNKWVKISGYVAFPVMAEGLDEMLMMLNQWDGCCIGVPPTPYDAIEVKLDKPAEGETRLLIMGTVTGRLQVDPYLVKDWLVSLYLMDDTVVTKQTGAPLRESEVRREHLAP